MIPILYRIDERTFSPARNYTSNGLGRLTECVSCTVTEERNGIYECEFQYPITGRFYTELITNGGIISVIHDDTKALQLFDVYAHTDPIDGIVTFNAHHISYRLANIILRPFTSSSVADTFDDIPNNTMNACPFTFWTDKVTTGEFKLSHPSNIRSILGGTEGSILDVYGGGDYEFDNFDVKLYANRGFDTGVTIRYGKNLADITNEFDTSGAFSAIVPYWLSEDGGSVYGNIVYSPTVRAAMLPWTKESGEEMEDGAGEVIEFPYAIITPVEMDFTDKFETQPTPSQLEEAALSYMLRNETWNPYHNIEIDFVQLWQTPEYESVAALQRVSLCDTVSVYFPEMGIIEAEQKVVKTVYNVLLERYDSMELGKAKTTLSDALTGEIDDAINQQSNFLRQFIMTQTELITGGLGGHVVFTMNAEGKPQEILIMDTDDVDTAVNVIRMNRNGIGFSTNGYSGPFESAWTIDGKFNANFIATGYLVANHIRGGTLSLGGYDDEYGLFRLLNADGSVNFQYDRNGMHHTTTSSTAGGTPSYLGTEISGTEIRSFYEIGSPSGYGIRTVIREGEIILQYSTSGRDSLNYLPIGRISANINGAGDYVFSLNNLHGSYNAFDPPSVIITYQANGYSQVGLRASETRVTGNFYCNGTKSRVVKTEEYGKRMLYCYETPSPLFGDVGEAVLDETGACYVFLDPVFAETIATRNYQVFLQKYGDGDIWVSERKPGYFVVQGTAGLAFGWELKSKQSDYDQVRLEKQDGLSEPIIHDYGKDAAEYIEELMKEREAA